jgi:hypothetical protein
MNAKSIRRRYQFSLKGIFVLLTVLGCLSALTSFLIDKWRTGSEYQKLHKMNDLILSSGGYWEEGHGLGLAHSNLTKEELRVLLKELKNFNNQTYVSLGGTKTDDSLIKELLVHHHLSSLGLSNTDITDNALRDIAEFKELIALEIENDSITDKGLEHLSTLPKLQYLKIGGTQVTNEGIQKLKSSIPGLEISRF